jgi:hypothetical protein
MAARRIIQLGGPRVGDPRFTVLRSETFSPLLIEISYWQWQSELRDSLRFLEEHYVRFGSHSCLSHGHYISTPFTYFNGV